MCDSVLAGADVYHCPRQHKPSLGGMRRILFPVAIALLLAGCGSDFRTPPLSRSQASARTEVLELKVVHVWDVVADALDHDREPGISHYIDVDVLSGTMAGKSLVLPYDEWNVGRKPPSDGSTIIAAPADWVKRGHDSKGRPFGGW